MPIPCPRRAYCRINGCQGLCSDKHRIQTNDCPKPLVDGLAKLSPVVQRASVQSPRASVRPVSRARGYRRGM